LNDGRDYTSHEAFPASLSKKRPYAMGIEPFNTNETGNPLSANMHPSGNDIATKRTDPSGVLPDYPVLMA